ncbi:MAG: class II aldolase/adducin family protein [Candidatus Tectomicrobia bacterium]|uniref:Class II aldolase/adducin family protein n=1 Tax=Tectimicrobiota bacterium TaxID=2528274 RepID=A0A932M1R1_UNCTE|nr:class II aldolase/adducin family protein [Candidatus Tectomicrobia bacterium]
MATDLGTLKKLVAQGSRILDATGVVDVFGHLSVRVPDSDRFLIPKAMSPGLVTPADVLTMNWNCDVVEGDGPPFIEAVIHSSIYQLRPDVQAVAHFHSPMVIVLTMVGKEVRPIPGSSSTRPFLEGTPIYDELTPSMDTLITTREQGESLARRLGTRAAVLLQGHGAVVVGSNVQETCLRSSNLERAAQLQVYAEMIGSPRYLSPQEAQRAREMLRQSNPAERSNGLQRFWDYYLKKSGWEGGNERARV